MKANPTSRSASFHLRAVISFALCSAGFLLAVAGLSNAVAGTIAGSPTCTWTPTGDLSIARDIHTATLLPDGRVLVVGGGGNGGSALASAELYDPGLDRVQCFFSTRTESA